MEQHPEINNLPSSFPISLGRNDLSGLKADSRYSLLLIQQGSLAMVTPRENRIIRKENCVLIPPGENKRRRQWKAAPGSKFMLLSLKETLLDQIKLSCWNHLELQNSIQKLWKQEMDSHPRVLPLQNSARLIPLMEAIEKEIAHKDRAWEIQSMQYLMQIFVFLYRNQDKADLATAQGRNNELINYLHEHYTDELSLNELAERFHLNPGYISAMFKKKVGMPLFEYINHIRIQKACVLLKRVDQPIIDIAYGVGYNNLSYFNRCFRKFMGMSPREYRNRMQQ